MKRIVFPFSVCLCFFVLSFSFAEEPIRFTAPAEKTTFSFSTALIHGELADKDATEVRLVNPRIHRGEDAVVGQAYQGRFKVLAPLRKGENTLTVRCGEASTAITLSFEPNENPNFARIVYMTDSSGNTEFQMPEGAVSQDYRRRLATAMKLMQTMTAERMNDLGYGYRTFNIELDENDDVVVHVLKGEKTAGEYYELFDRNEIFGQIYREVDRAFPDDTRVLVIPAYSRWDVENCRDRGHTALGGGRLALFGGCTLYCWPTDLETAVHAMLDTTRIDKTKLKDDSVGRSVYWACAATCIGASLHELGHAMELPHTNDWTDIMTRGHDHFFRVFLVREAPSAKTSHNRWTDFKPAQMARFAPPSASTLIVGRWFASNNPSDRKRADISVSDNRKAGTVTVAAQNGIACIQAIQEGRVVFFDAAAPEQVLRGEFPKTKELAYEAIRPSVKKGVPIQIRVCDGKGFFGRNQTVRLDEETPKPGRQVAQTALLPRAEYFQPQDAQARTESAEKVDYLLFLPEDYDAEAGKTWPLLLFLHGFGERGDDIDRVKAHGPPKILENRDRAKTWPFITVSPQLPAQESWSPLTLARLLDEIERKYKVDRSRVYVTGLSQGGQATWNLLYYFPQRFAAGVPICSGCNPDLAPGLVDKPIWAFHGEQDNLADPKLSRDSVDAIKAAGGEKIKLTLYPDTGHFSWPTTYDNEEVYRWLLEQKLE